MNNLLAMEVDFFSLFLKKERKERREGRKGVLSEPQRLAVLHFFLHARTIFSPKFPFFNLFSFLPLLLFHSFTLADCLIDHLSLIIEVFIGKLVYYFVKSHFRKVWTWENEVVGSRNGWISLHHTTLTIIILL